MKIKNITQDLRDKGYRITKTRRSILHIFVENKKPFSAPEILEKLKEAGIKVNKVTVYRELDVLKEENIIQEIIFGDGKKRYEFADVEHHHHLVCIQCRSVQDIVIDKYKGLEVEEKRIETQNNFKVLRHSLEFFGLCSKCK